MKHFEQEIYNDGSRSVVAHVEVSDDAILVSAPRSGTMAWAMNSEPPRCPEQFDCPEPKKAGVRCERPLGHTEEHTAEANGPDQAAMTHPISTKRATGAA